MESQTYTQKLTDMVPQKTEILQYGYRYLLNEEQNHHLNKSVEHNNSALCWLLWWIVGQPPTKQTPYNLFHVLCSFSARSTARCLSYIIIFHVQQFLCSEFTGPFMLSLLYKNREKINKYKVV